MTIEVRSRKPDRVEKQIIEALRKYQEVHPKAEIAEYRQNSVSVRVRIVNDEFVNKSRSQREDEVWAVLSRLPEETTAEISLLLLLTPAEAKKSFASFEFDNPTPSRI